MGKRGASGSFRSLLVSLCCASPLILAAAGPVGGRTAQTYPDWFIRPPSVPGVRVATGYASLSGDTSASIFEALENGRNTLRLSSALRVRAEYLQEVLPNGSVAFRGEHYEEDTLAAQIDSVVALDTVLLNRMVLLLVATREAPIPARASKLPSKPPTWISVTPQTRDGAYAVGGVDAHFNEHEAWMEAERQARRSLAFATVTSLQSAAESRTGGTSNGALIATTVTELRDVVVRERWRDERRLFVLVHARAVTPAGS